MALQHNFTRNAVVCNQIYVPVSMQACYALIINWNGLIIKSVIIPFFLAALLRK